MSKLILLLTLLIGAFLTFMCVNENKTALSAKYNQTNNEPVQVVKTEEITPKELEKPFFIYSKESFSAKLSSKDKSPNFEYFKSNYCPDDKCKQEITFDDNVEVSNWQDDAINLAAFLKDKDIKDGAVSISDGTLKVKGELNDEDNLEQLNKLLEPFSENNFEISNTTNIKQKEEELEEQVVAEGPSTQQIQSDIAQLLKNEPIYFKHASAIITPESKVTLDKIVTATQKIKPLSLKVEGHTDAVGNNSYNMKLSQQRATSVKKYLKQKIPDAVIESIGFGENQPISKNPKEKINRRVEIYIQGGE